MPGSEIDLRAAVNAISDVIQNRPAPLREFDQIYMKAGDMVMQAEQIARWADGKHLAFIGDGDAISICCAYLKKREIFPYGPDKVTVFDFDERMCGSVERFADAERLVTLSSVLYNCLDPFPGPTDFDCFYTNPPWGASNQGESVKVFVILDRRVWHARSTNTSERTRVVVFFGYSPRWIAQREIAPPELLARETVPLRRQILGGEDWDSCHVARADLPVSALLLRSKSAIGRA